ncbi:MAG: S41 family peptidase [Clostridia bacterium]
MKNNFTRRIICLLLVITMLFSFASCGINIGDLINNNPSVGDVDKVSTTLVNRALAYLKSNYVDKLTDEQMIEAAIAGANQILQQYDKYGKVLTPEQTYELFNPSTTVTSGDIFGFGYVQIQYLGLYVSTIIIDSPAYNQGLLSEDIIVDIKYAPVTAFGRAEPITYIGEDNQEHILSAKGTPVLTISKVLSKITTRTLRFTVLRGGTDEMCYEDGKKLEIDIARGTIYNDNLTQDNQMYFVEYYGGSSNGNLIANVSSKTIKLRSLKELDETNIGYIRINQFGSVTYQDGKTTSTSVEVKKALDILKTAGKTKIIIDLKDNPGGDVSQVQAVAGFFIKDDLATTQNLLVTTLKDRNNKSMPYSVTSSYSNYFSKDGLNIVVLTNANSASASELLTGALIDYNTAVQVGDTTYGKGIAQTYLQFTDLPKDIEVDGKVVKSYYGIYYTVAYYYSPKGINIHGVGYTPNAGNIIDGYDQQILRAISLLTAK